MLHGLGYGVSDIGADPSVRLVETITLGDRDAVQSLDTNVGTHLSTFGTCKLKLIFQEYFNN